MLDCQIVGLAQDMDFGENVSQTFVLLQLPDGRRVRACVNEETAQAVVELQVQARGVPRAVMRAAGAAPEPGHAQQTAWPEGTEDAEYATTDFTTAETPDGTVRVFGGQDDTPAEDTADYATPPGMDHIQPEHEDLPIIADPDPPQKSRSKDKSPKRTARVAAAQAADHARAVPNGRPRNLFRTAEGKLIAPSKTVPRTEQGYPQVANGGVDVDELTGTRDRDQDEDGVGSI
jgi:hypothetical protein